MNPAELERLLAAAASDPAERPAFTQALLESEVYVLGTMDPPPVKGVANVNSTARLVALADADGQVTPFFTSERMLEATLLAHPGTDRHFLRLACRSLLQMTRGSRLVLNPNGPHCKVFLPDEVEALLRGNEPGMERRVLEQQAQVLVGAPAHVPPDLPATLSRFFAQRPVVHAARLGWIAHGDGHAGYLMVVTASDRESAMAGFGSLQIGESTEGHTLDVLVVPPTDEGHLLSAIEPFYVRQPQADLPATRPPRRFRRG